MDKKDQNKTYQTINNKIDLKNLIQNINKEFEEKLNEFQTFSSLFQKYLSITTDYKNNISNKILNPLQNTYKCFGNFFSIFRQTLEIQLSFIDGYILLMNKITVTVEIQERKKRINELIDHLKTLIFDDDFLVLNKKIEDYNNQLSSIEDLLIQNETKKKELIENEILKGKNCEKAYLDFINIINKKRKKILKEGNEKINELISLNKNIYNDLGIFAQSIGKGYLINLEDELKNLNEFTLGIEKSFDINRLINQQEKNLKPISINKIIFIPYSLKIFDKMEKEKFSKTKSITLNHFIDVVIKMKNNFKQIAESFNEEIEREKNFILEEAKYILDSSTLISIEQSKFDKLLNLLNNRENRLFFMISLNKIRAEGNFDITFHGTFKQLGIILKFILEKIKKEKDYEIMKYIIIMSQTYYCFDNNNNKIYLIKYIENDSLFQSKEFWKSHFQKTIDIELENLEKKKSLVNQENNKEDKLFNVSNIVFSKLLSVIHNMLEFRFNKNNLKEFVKEYIEKYSIKEEMMEQMFLLIGDKEYDNYETFDEEKSFVQNVNLNKNINDDKLKGNIITNNIDNKEADI